MAATSRRKATPLSEELLEYPQRFEFPQALRLLEAMLPGRADVGGDEQPARERVRFRSSVSLVHPVADVSRLEEVARKPEEPGDAPPFEMEVTFMGMGSPWALGSLPMAYTQAIHDQRRNGDKPALRDFLDLFNHRFVSLFYRAWKRSRVGPAHDLGERGGFARALRAVLGTGTTGLGGRQPLGDELLMARAGLIAMAPAPAAAIESLLASYLDCDVAIEPFRPQWYATEPEDRTRLGVSGSRLGQDLFLGSEVLMVQSRFRVCIGPLARADYDSLLPDQPGHDVVCRMIRMACGTELDFEVQLVLAAEDVPALRLEDAPELPSRLGWSSWLGKRSEAIDAGDAVLEGGSQLVQRAA